MQPPVVATDNIISDWKSLPATDHAHCTDSRCETESLKVEWRSVSPDTNHQRIASGRGGAGGGRGGHGAVVAELLPGAVVARAPLMITLQGKALIFSTDSAPWGVRVTSVTTYSLVSHAGAVTRGLSIVSAYIIVIINIICIIITFITATASRRIVSTQYSEVVFSRQLLHCRTSSDAKESAGNV